MFSAFYFLRQNLTLSLKVSLSSLCSPGWHQSHRDATTSASRMLGIQACITTPGNKTHFFANCSSKLWKWKAEFSVTGNKIFLWNLFLVSLFPHPRSRIVHIPKQFSSCLSPSLKSPHSVIGGFCGTNALRIGQDPAASPGSQNHWWQLLMKFFIDLFNFFCYQFLRLILHTTD